MIGSNIREKRVQLGMTQEKFAELIGCSQSNVSKYENEELGIDAMMIPKIISGGGELQMNAVCAVLGAISLALGILVAILKTRNH